MKTFATVTTGLLLIGAVAGAQEPRPINGPVEREITGGASHSYTIVLEAGDYLAGSIDQQGRAPARRSSSRSLTTLTARW